MPRSPCATTTRNCAPPPRYRYADPPRPNVSSPARSQPHAVASHFKQSNTPPMSLEDFQQYLFHLRSGFVFAALAVCHHYAQLCVSASILLSNLAAISSCTVQFHTDPMVVRGDDKLCTNQHPPYVPGGLSKNSILPPFWVGACLVHHKLPLRTADVLVCPRRAIINATRVALMPQRRI